jgi:hypothetical protein
VNKKPVKKSPMPKKEDKASYEQPLAPKKPHSTSSKGKPQDGQMKVRKK